MAEVIEQIDINIKYDGYIRRQQKQVEQIKKLERNHRSYEVKMSGG